MKLSFLFFGFWNVGFASFSLHTYLNGQDFILLLLVALHTYMATLCTVIFFKN